MAEETKKSKKIGFKNLIMGERSLLATVLLIILVIASLVSAYLGCTRIVYDRAYKQLEDAANTVNDQVRSKFDRDREVLNATAEIIADSHAFDSEDIGADEFSKELADLADVYVCDAFGSSHRAHASVAGVTKFITQKGGENMAEGLWARLIIIGRLLRRLPKKNCRPL